MHCRHLKNVQPDEKKSELIPKSSVTLGYRWYSYILVIYDAVLKVITTLWLLWTACWLSSSNWQLLAMLISMFWHAPSPYKQAITTSYQPHDKTSHFICAYHNLVYFFGHHGLYGLSVDSFFLYQCVKWWLKKTKLG